MALGVNALDLFAGCNVLSLILLCLKMNYFNDVKGKSKGGKNRHLCDPDPVCYARPITDLENYGVHQIAQFTMRRSVGSAGRGRRSGSGEVPKAPESDRGSAPVGAFSRDASTCHCVYVPPCM